MTRVAIIHDWLTTYAGSERVLEQLLILYPEADLYAVCDFITDQERFFLRGRQPRTSFIQHLPGARRHCRQYLPLMPMAVEQFDMSDYDIVISSSHAVAKGVLTGPDQLHVSYVHTPIRYAWDMQHQYLREARLDKGLRGLLARYFLHRIRVWDSRTANGVDKFVANSNFIGRRIHKVYRREFDVIYPPVDVDVFTPGGGKENFYLTASRLVPYKRIDLIVQAFTQMPTRRLVVIGDGAERAKIERLAAGHANINLMGYQSSASLLDHMRRAKAFVFAAEEDFGIVPVEAQACGTPVIAYGRGGVLETVRELGTERPTGLFFDNQSAESIIQAIEKFELHDISSTDCRENALRFSPECFRENFSALVEKAYSRFKN